MSPWLLVAIALITYGSRAAALAFLPRPTGRLEAVLERMPAPIFASLATLTLITSERTLADGPVLAAAVGALLVSPKRSLAVCLIGGIAGYALGALLL
ncbi:MAG: AzlD domain-containing protein [Actinobacteria bacterium]|nr:AzlD domain-containing protein [Actinomycetota bacterium]